MMLAEALRYHRQYGWSIIPVWWVRKNGLCGCGSLHSGDEKSIGKHPIIPWKPYQKQRATEEQVKEWWTKYPYASIAVVTGRISNLGVVDDDERGASSERFDTLVSCTGGGGHHYLFRLEAVSGQIPSKNRIDSHTDVKAEGGYVLLPPSSHISGKRYSWANSKSLIPFPEEIKTLLNGVKPVNSNGQVHREGSRNDAMMREVCSLFGKGYTPYETFEKIKEWNQEWNFPPLTEKELKACVASIWNNQEKPKRTEKQYKQRQHPTGELQIRSSEYMFAKYGAKEQTWLIPGWLPSATCCIIGAPPETYKTWLMLHLAYSLTSGEPFLGKYRVAKTGRVLIAQQEDNFTATLDRFSRVTGLGEPGDWLIQMPDLLPDWTEDRMLHVENDLALRNLRDYVAECRPILVIIDPMYSFVPLADDFGVSAAQLINSKIKSLRDEYDTSFMLLHHTGKAANHLEKAGGRKRDSLWGSQFLNAGLETAWHLRCPVEGSNIVEIQRHTKVSGHASDVRLRWLINDWACNVQVLDD